MQAWEEACQAYDCVNTANILAKNPNGLCRVMKRYIQHAFCLHKIKKKQSEAKQCCLDYLQHVSDIENQNSEDELDCLDSSDIETAIDILTDLDETELVAKFELLAQKTLY